MSRAVLGLDVGGANLKAVQLVDGFGVQAVSWPFPLWKQPAQLPVILAQLIHFFCKGDVPIDLLAVTMTGELCDCFESKRQGVAAILDAVTWASGCIPIRVWRNDGRFVDLATAKEAPMQIAAANWLALATFAGRLWRWGPALLVDVGSTTTDVIPLLDGRPVPVGRTDPERLRSGELVYTGVRRTPLCALLGGEGAAEVFATTLDAYLVLGCIDEHPAQMDTADGRPATRDAAQMRLARMLCADLETSTEEERVDLAEQVAIRQVERIAAALAQVAARLPASPQAILLAGEGEFLAERAARHASATQAARIVPLSAKFDNTSLSVAACAYAIAVLAAEHEGKDR